jgi:hypothetical protein
MIERTRRLIGGCVLLTGVACPCHLLAAGVVGVIGLVAGAAPVLTPDAQDGVHALYLPAAMLIGVKLVFDS